MKIECDFLDSVNLNPAPPPSPPDFEFSTMNCTTTEATNTIPLVISDGENHFNLYPNFSYADVVIIFFLICFFALKIFSGIWNFVHVFIIRQKWFR